MSLSPYFYCRITVAFVWFYHGLVPKLLGPHSDELAMNMILGWSLKQATYIAYAEGVGEILFSLLLLLCWEAKWPLILSCVAMIGLGVFSVVAIPSLSLAAFNPVTTNICVFVLSYLAYKLKFESIDKVN